MDYLDPIKVLEELTKKRAPLTLTFHDEYECYLELLNGQLFEPNGYKLVVIKSDPG